MHRRLKRITQIGTGVVLCFGIVTFMAVTPVKTSLRALLSDAQTLQITDRNGKPLTITYQNRWNTYDNLPLHAIPNLLQQAFIASEDKRFFDHGGVDWHARGGALLQNWKSGHAVRGASTLTEQVVRMIHPRPRNIWSKWVEGIEAALLEQTYSKADIFEFYLNQVPYASNRRGVAQAARYYFDRDVTTLSPKEILALAVLVRAPSSYDLYKDSTKIDAAINRLAVNLTEQGCITQKDASELQQQRFTLASPSLPVNISHFANYLRSRINTGGTELHSTLDANLQAQVQEIIDDRVRFLSRKNVHNAAVLVVDHTTGDVLSWTVAGANDPDVPGNQIDAVTVPRQPGSALKPFLYAAALERGWTPATLINDAPLSEAIGTGLHNFKNYSNTYYGMVTLREALANSLNIPAILTVNHVGIKEYLKILHQLGFESLDRGADIYDQGLALGNGEVTLFELVQGYTALANRGVWRPLRIVKDDAGTPTATAIYTPETASLIGNILSDSWARRLEFGNNSILNMPIQTAIKTGTSTDYRDTWAVGFNHRYVVGIWMGNLDHSPTDGITGSTGPALALRSIFNELGKNDDAAPLWLSPKLAQKDICIDDPSDAGNCYTRSEYFLPGTTAATTLAQPESKTFKILKPTDGLQIALDPRIPANRQKLPFTAHGLKEGQTVEWILDGETIALSHETYLWQATRGQHRLHARVSENGKIAHVTPEISYVVK